jgi:hypothetical protein|tara:strand:+ start:11 stop:229 length:219 start_codon:yes stop_codon:yes gene_type:complete
MAAPKSPPSFYDLGTNALAPHAAGDLARGLTRGELQQRFTAALHALADGDSKRAQSILLLGARFDYGSPNEE